MLFNYVGGAIAALAVRTLTRHCVRGAAGTWFRCVPAVYVPGMYVPLLRAENV